MNSGPLVAAGENAPWPASLPVAASATLLLGLSNPGALNRLVTIDVDVPLPFRDAILFDEPSLFGINRVATDRAGDRLWLPEEHVDLSGTV